MRLTLAATAALLTLAASAQAAPIAPVARGGAEVGPALAGERVVFTRTTGRTWRVLTAAPGVAPHLQHAEEARHRNGELNGVAVAASPSRTAFAFGELLPVDPDGATAHQQAYAGPPSGPFAPFAGSASGDAVVVDDVDVSGDALLTIERTSSKRQAFVTHNGARTQIGGDIVFHARIAGPYVAWAAERSDAVQRVTVTNWQTGAELYHVDVRVTPPYGFGMGLDVQEDGTIAVRPANPASTGSKPVSDLAWASAAAPSLHVVAREIGNLPVRISGGRILFEAAVFSRSRALLIADLDGGIRAASFPLDHVVGADLDGSRVAFATSDCVYMGDVPVAEPTTAPAGTCPQSVVRMETAATKTKGRVKVTLSCTMWTGKGCDGTITLRTPKAAKRKTLVLATRSFHLTPDSRASFNVTMSTRRLRDLRARVGRTRKTAFVDVRATTRDSAGLSSSAYRGGAVRLR